MAFETDKSWNETPAQVEEELPIAEVSGIPSIYCDGPRAAEIHGENVHLIFCETQGPPGCEISVPVLRMIRPLKSCGRGDAKRLVETARARNAGRCKPRH